ncbi:MAG TPA: hypothetical protein VGH49_09180 [Xanthobacteraceae bacterium]|jgi:hypothetical protein
MFLIGFPLLVVPFAIYNMIAFLLPGFEWSHPIVTVHLMSGAEWPFTSGELLVAVAIMVLFFEMLKSRRLADRSIIDHLLSVLLLAALIAEFVLVRQAASGTFFLLAVIGFVDMAGGFTMRAARRSVPAAVADEAHPA